MAKFAKPFASKKDQESGTTFAPKFDDNGLISAIITDATTGEVLMLGYMNAESLSLTLETGESHFWSRSRQEIWHKGATSGNVQKVKSIQTDCDQDALVVRVDVIGAAATCHTGRTSCFYRSVEAADDGTAQLAFGSDQPKFDPEKVYQS